MNEEAAEQIVDRLKAEGDLIRNSGTNSIRSVKIQLDRFEDIFNVISENLIAQTAMLAKSLDIQSAELDLMKDEARREEAAKQLEDLEAKQDQIELKKPESKKDEEKEGRGLFSLLSGMGIGKLLMGGALIGGGLFVAYNLAKGFVDEMYGNAWTNFEEGLVSTIQGVDWASIGNDLRTIAESISGLASFLASFNFGDIISALSFGAVSRMILRSNMPPQMKAASIAAAALFFVNRGDSDEGGSGILGGPTRIPDEEVRGEGEGSLADTRRQAEIAAVDQGPEAAAAIMQEFRSRHPTALPPGGIIRSPVQTEYWENWLRSQRTGLRPMSLEEITDEIEHREQEARDLEAVGSPLAQVERAKVSRLIQDLQDRHNLIDSQLTDLEISNRIDSDEWRELAAEMREVGALLQRFDALRGSVEINPVGDQSSLNVPFEVRPASVSGYSVEEVAESLLAHIVEAAEVGRITSAADRVATAADGAVAMIVVNNTPVVNAPVTNVRGGPSIHNSTYFGSGGGSPTNPYGLTSAIS